MHSDAQPANEETYNRSEFRMDESSKDALLSGWKLGAIFFALAMSTLIIALDQSIVATAIPRIVSDFNALSQISWIAAAYLLTQGALVLPFGLSLAIAPAKWIYLSCIVLFEIGSLICAVAPSMSVLIFGRAVAGCGAAGLSIAMLSVIELVSRLEDRPVFLGVLGMVLALASIAGPLLGGAFTDHVTWRWCFYINLPIGGISFVLIAYLLKATPPAGMQNRHGKSQLSRWMELDWVGTILSFGLVTALILALTWAGNTKAWNSATIIALFCVTGVLVILFALWERFVGQKAIMPGVIMRNRSAIATGIAAFFQSVNFLVGTFYLPLWYQATRGHSATKSGIDILPFMISTITTVFIAGGIVKKSQRYWYFLMVSPIISAVGSGLLYTITTNTSDGRLIGYQILFGVGIGGAMQNVLIAIQAEYAPQPHLSSRATAIVMFSKLLGGVVGIAIAGAIFANQLSKNLVIYAPDLSPALARAVKASFTAIYDSSFPSDRRGRVIEAYVKSLGPILIIGVPSGGLAAVAALFINNHNLKRRADQAKGKGKEGDGA